jgi:hypothetical protein
MKRNLSQVDFTQSVSNLKLPLEQIHVKAARTTYASKFLDDPALPAKEDPRFVQSLYEKNTYPRFLDNTNMTRKSRDKPLTEYEVSKMSRKSANSKKIVLDSDDERDILEIKEIEPLMILTHQNLKPTKYLFNTQNMAEKLNDHDKKFLSSRLPNLFK